MQNKTPHTPPSSDTSVPPFLQHTPSQRHQLPRVLLLPAVPEHHAESAGRAEPPAGRDEAKVWRVGRGRARTRADPVRAGKSGRHHAERSAQAVPQHVSSRIRSMQKGGASIVAITTLQRGELNKSGYKQDANANRMRCLALLPDRSWQFFAMTVKTKHPDRARRFF